MKRISAIGILALLWFLVHLFLLIFYGDRRLTDAEGYLTEADYILANGKFEDVRHFFYLTHIISIISFRWIFPNLVLPVIFFQCMVSGFALLLLYKASVKISGNHLAAFFSCLIFLFWWDNIHWNVTFMTESLACSLTCILIYLLTCFKGRRKDFILIFILLVLVFFSRPTGVIPIAGAVLFLFLYYWDTVSKTTRLILIAGVLISGILAADQMFLRWDFTEQYMQGNIVTYMNTMEGTELYEPGLRLDPGNLIIAPSDEHPLMKMLIFMYDNPFHFLKACVLKFWYLISGTRPYYTKLHNAFSYAWLLMVYVFFFFGWKQLKNKPVRMFVLCLIVLNCAIVSISTVDWDNRFYTPMEPAIVLVAGMGAARLLEMFSHTSVFKQLYGMLHKSS